MKDQSTQPTLSVRLRHVAWLTALAGAMTLTACGQESSEQTAGEKVDATVATVEQKTEAAGDRIAEGAAEVKNDISDATADARDAVADAAITAAVNAKFAADDSLSALNIDVDTTNGTVDLKGTAPTQEALDRATMLAKSVDGVTSVNNELTVKAS